MAVSWSKQKNVSEVAAKLRTDLGLGTAALADTDDFATAADLTAAIDGFDSSFNAKVDVSRQVIAGRGLTGAGSLAADRIISADIADASALSAGSPDKLVDAAALKSTKDAIMEAIQPSGSYVSAEISWVSNSMVTLTHGLGQRPKNVQAVMVCKVAERGWAVGDRVLVSGPPYSTYGVQLGMTDTQIFANMATYIYLGQKGVGTATDCTAANWRLVVEASL